MQLLTINSGSCSLKFRLYPAPDQSCLLSSSVQRSGNLRHSCSRCDSPSSSLLPSDQDKVAVLHHDARLCQSVCDKLSMLGISLDDQKNQTHSQASRDISSANSPVSVLVSPTNEELEFTRQTITVLNNRKNQCPQSAE